MKAAIAICVLLALLAGAVWVGHYGWESAGDVVMPPWGWLMMFLGIFFTVVVGGGLMALIFYSSVPDTMRRRKWRRTQIPSLLQREAPAEREVGKTWIGRAFAHPIDSWGISS